MPDSGRIGAFTSTEEMLTALNNLTVTISVVNAKLDTVIEDAQKREDELSSLSTELHNVKARLYSMSGIVGVGVSLATSWVTNQVLS